MPCCSQKSDTDDDNVEEEWGSGTSSYYEYYGRAFKYDRHFKGPLSKRSYTDVSCLFIFTVFLCFWGFMAGYAFRTGNLHHVMTVTDSLGQKCGIDSNVANKPYLLFFNLEKCVDINVVFHGCQSTHICIENCPNASFIYNEKSCTLNNFMQIRNQLICKTDVNISGISTCGDITKLMRREECARWYLPSISVFGRCIPKNISKLIDLVTDENFDLKTIATDATILQGVIENLKNGQFLLEIWGDLKSTWCHILIGFGVAAIASIILIVLMRYFAAPLVWISIFGTIGVLSFGTYYAIDRYIYLHNNRPQDVQINTNLLKWLKSLWHNANTFFYGGILLATTLFFVVIFVLLLRKRIILATALAKEGSRAVCSTVSSVFFPILPTILKCLVVIFAIAVSLFLVSIGEPINQVIGRINDPNCVCSGPAEQYKDGVKCNTTIFNEHCRDSASLLPVPCKIARCNFKEMLQPTGITYYHIMNGFGLVWSLSFLSAFNQMVLAGTFATWYWTFHKKNVPFCTVATGLERTVRYHLGTIAFGSIILALCRIIRIVLEYVDYKLRKLDNDVSRFLLNCLRCCFWCLDKFIRYANRNAYIMCAIHGKSFCKSAKIAFNLLMRNIVRAFALHKFTRLLFFFFKMLLICGMGYATYIFFNNENCDVQVNHIAVPIIIVMIGTLIITRLFWSVYSMAIDTMFLCFLEDSERNDGSEQRPYFMSKQLMKILGRKNAVSRKKYREIGKKMSRRSTPRFASFSDRNTRPAVSFAEPVSVVLASTSAANTAPITSSPVQIRTRGMKQFR